GVGRDRMAGGIGALPRRSAPREDIEAVPYLARKAERVEVRRSLRIGVVGPVVERANGREKGGEKVVRERLFSAFEDGADLHRRLADGHARKRGNQDIVDAHLFAKFTKILP